jgi:hypothetical protein
MITIDDALDHLGFDQADEVVRKNVTRALNSAEATLRGSVGEDVEKYLPNDPRIDTLILAYLDDLYDERGVSAKVSNATRYMVSSQEWQLRLELQRAKEGATQ